MYKIYLACIDFATSVCEPLYSNRNSGKSIRISFAATEATGRKTDATSEEFNYCLEMLKNFSALSKKRTLTTEEIIMALQLVNYLFATANDDFSKKIVVTIHGKHTLELPFSEKLFALMQQLNSQDDAYQEQEDQEATAA